MIGLCDDLRDVLGIVIRAVLHLLIEELQLVRGIFALDAEQSVDLVLRQFVSTGAFLGEIRRHIRHGSVKQR